MCKHKTIDVKSLLTMPIYKLFADVVLFQKVKVYKFGGITWGNDIDCCADILYQLNKHLSL